MSSGGGGGGGRRRGPVTLCTAATKRIRPTPHVPTPQPPPLPPAVTGAAFSEEIVQAEDEAETLALHRDEAVMLLLHRDEVLASGLIRCKLHALTIDLAGRFSRTIGILKRGTMIEGLVSKSFLTNLCNILLARRRLMDCSPVRGIWLEVPDVKYQKAACAISYCQPQWDAYLKRRLSEKLVYIYNFVKMLRFTGIPVSILLLRAQSIELFKKSNQKTVLVIPDIKGHRSRLNTFEGATFLESKPTATYGDKSPRVSDAVKTQVFVKHPHGTLSLQLDTNKDVEFLKEEVEQRLKLDISECFFIYGLSKLEAGKPLSSYDIEKDSNIIMVGRLRGGRRYQTLSQYFLQHEDDLLRTVALPDGYIGVELTELGCLLLSSLIHLFTAVFVSGQTWNGTFNKESFQVHHGRVRIKEQPHVILNKDTLHSDCIRLSEMIKTMFVRDGVYPPYLQHLLKLLDGLEEDVFTVEKKLAFDSHVSLISSLNRENLVYQIKKSYDGWHESEKQRFRTVANRCKAPEEWAENLIHVPLFHDVISGGQKSNFIYSSDGTGAFFFVRNYNTHAPKYSWIDLRLQSRYEKYQWFKINNGVELMIPKYMGDFLAEAVVTLIEENFDIREALRTCSALVFYTNDSSQSSSSSDSSSDSTSNDSPRKESKRRSSVSSQKKKSRRYANSSSDRSTSINSSKKRKIRHSVSHQKSSRSRHSKK